MRMSRKNDKVFDRHVAQARFKMDKRTCINLEKNYPSLQYVLMNELNKSFLSLLERSL